MTIEFLKCRADLIFEVDFGSNGAIEVVAIWWVLILIGKYNNFPQLCNFFQNPNDMPLSCTPHYNSVHHN